MVAAGASEAMTPFDRQFEIMTPAAITTPLVFNSPHAGRVYPPSLLAASRLDERGLRRSEDFLVDRLFAAAPEHGAPLLLAHFPRAYLDVNREPYELDPRMFDGRLPAYANTRSLRVAGGLGTIPKIVGDGHDIYARRIPVGEGLHRIEAIYRPYHAALRGLVQDACRRFGEAVLIDCHSMPSASLGPDHGSRPDIVLGDRYGASAAPQLVDAAEDIFAALGYAVARNRPYAGGFITEHYGQPAAGVHALQIEINRALYMDESGIAAHDGFNRLAADMARFVGSFAPPSLGRKRPRRAASRHRSVISHLRRYGALQNMQGETASFGSWQSTTLRPGILFQDQPTDI
jgi:N-formylglutamate amidohydrolase